MRRDALYTPITGHRRRRIPFGRPDAWGGGDNLILLEDGSVLITEEVVQSGEEFAFERESDD